MLQLANRSHIRAALSPVLRHIDKVTVEAVRRRPYSRKIQGYVPVTGRRMPAFIAVVLSSMVLGAALDPGDGLRHVDGTRQ